MAPGRKDEGYLPLTNFDVQSKSTVQGLSTTQLNKFREDGYLILPNALDQGTVQALLKETHQMLNDFSISDHPMTRFSTGEGNDKEHVGDDYFLTSGDKVRFFFEEGKLSNQMQQNIAGIEAYTALDAFDSAGNLTKPKERSINKIGHYLHELSPSFRRISLSPRNAAIAESLEFSDPRVLQSMIICKQPEIGGRVPPHQDSTFLYTDPPSAVGFWYALEDATLSNGCLSFARGSHKTCPVRKRFTRQTNKAGEVGTGFEDNARAMFPAGEGEEWAMMDDEMDEGDPRDEDYSPGEVKAGSLVLIHGNLMHKSEKNTSGKSRFIYTFHMIEGENVYDDANWLQPPAQGFSRLYMESAFAS